METTNDEEWVASGGEDNAPTKATPSPIVKGFGGFRIGNKKLGSPKTEMKQREFPELDKAGFEFWVMHQGKMVQVPAAKGKPFKFKTSYFEGETLLLPRPSPNELWEVRVQGTFIKSPTKGLWMEEHLEGDTLELGLLTRGLLNALLLVASLWNKWYEYSFGNSSKKTPAYIRAPFFTVPDLVCVTTDAKKPSLMNTPFMRESPVLKKLRMDNQSNMSIAKMVKQGDVISFSFSGVHIDVIDWEFKGLKLGLGLTTGNAGMENVTGKGGVRVAVQDSAKGDTVDSLNDVIAMEFRNTSKSSNLAEAC